MPTNPKDKHREYMRSYIANAEDVYCPECNVTYKKYRKYRHVKTQKHLKNVEKANEKETDKPLLERLLKKVENLEAMLANTGKSKATKKPVKKTAEKTDDTD